MIYDLRSRKLFHQTRLRFDNLKIACGQKQNHNLVFVLRKHSDTSFFLPEFWNRSSVLGSNYLESELICPLNGTTAVQSGTVFRAESVQIQGGTHNEKVFHKKWKNVSCEYDQLSG